MKNIVKILAVIAVLACATGAEAQNPWRVQQRYQKQYQRDVRHPATARPLHNYRRPKPPVHQHRYGQPKFQLNLGKFNLSIGGHSHQCPPFFFYRGR